MPSNGVVLIAGGVGADFEIVLSRGAETFTGLVADVPRSYVSFRPDQELSPGTYHVVVTRLSWGDEIAFDVEVVQPYTPAPHELMFSFDVLRTTMPGGNLACCEPEPETRTLDDGCFFTELVEKPLLRWSAVSPLPIEHAQQFLYRISASPAESPSWPWGDSSYDDFRIGPASSPWIIAEQRAEYCMTAEAQSMIDGQVFTTEVCAKDPGTALVTKPRESFMFAFNIGNCPLPPTGLETLWCAELRDDCNVQSLSDEAAQSRLQECEGFQRLCEPQPPTVVRQGSGGGCNTNGNAATAPALWALALLLLTARRRADWYGHRADRSS
jgi:hypothetical protein